MDVFDTARTEVKVSVHRPHERDIGRFCGKLDTRESYFGLRNLLLDACRRAFDADAVAAAD
jgi:hypothetical protein